MSEEIPAQLGTAGAQNELEVVPQMRLGRLPLKTTRKALQFSTFFNFVNLPKKTGYWTKKSPLPLRTFGNDEYGDCTRAKQAYAAIRMERIEQKRTINITDEEVIRVYVDMSNRLYGGGDQGAYEDDALNEWRRPETTFRDTQGHPLTIDAYLRINAMNHEEVKAGLALSGARGIAVCFNLPAAASSQRDWDVPEGQALVSKWMPGSWGGHSCWAIDYDGDGMIVDDTWASGPRRASWRFVAAYMDEAHLVIDSVNAWRKKGIIEETPMHADAGYIRKALGDVADAVNAISSQQIQMA
jgi:hypothetical protein